MPTDPTLTPNPKILLKPKTRTVVPVRSGKSGELFGNKSLYEVSHSFSNLHMQFVLKLISNTHEKSLTGGLEPHAIQAANRRTFCRIRARERWSATRLMSYAWLFRVCLANISNQPTLSYWDRKSMFTIHLPNGAGLPETW